MRRDFFYYFQDYCFWHHHPHVAKLVSHLALSNTIFSLKKKIKVWHLSSSTTIKMTNIKLKFRCHHVALHGQENCQFWNLLMKRSRGCCCWLASISPCRLQVVTPQNGNDEYYTRKVPRTTIIIPHDEKGQFWTSRFIWFVGWKKFRVKQRGSSDTLVFLQLHSNFQSLFVNTIKLWTMISNSEVKL